MQYVHEYSVDISGITKLPKGAEILSVAFKPLTIEIVVYALVDPAEPMMERRITAYSTDRPVPDNRKKFIGTVTNNHGTAIHLFDLGEIDV